jgi:hypothetical protein
MQSSKIHGPETGATLGADYHLSSRTRPARRTPRRLVSRFEAARRPFRQRVVVPERRPSDERSTSRVASIARYSNLLCPHAGRNGSGAAALPAGICHGGLDFGRTGVDGPADVAASATAAGTRARGGTDHASRLAAARRTCAGRCPGDERRPAAASGTSATTAGVRGADVGVELRRPSRRAATGPRQTAEHE